MIEWADRATFEAMATFAGVVAIALAMGAIPRRPGWPPPVEIMASLAGPSGVILALAMYRWEASMLAWAYRGN